MSYLPSHKNSANERSGQRQNWKESVRQNANAKQAQLSPEAARAKFGKQAAMFLAAGRITVTGSVTHVAVGDGSRFYPVYKIQGRFHCGCRDRDRYGFCAHEKAAAAFAAKQEAVISPALPEDEKPFRAELRYGNRKGLDFDQSQRFADKREACEWLVRESFNKFQPEGEITDIFGAIVFEITDEFFDSWAEV